MTHSYKNTHKFLIIYFLSIISLNIYAFSGGTGTALDPYLISTATDLKALSDDVNGGNLYATSYFKQTSNIDLLIYPSWTPIGGILTNWFSGTFDGDGFTISNLKNPNNRNNVGLFGYTQGATLKNIKITTQSNNSVASFNNSGILVGYMDGGAIDNCIVSGEVGTANQSGGLVGYALGGAQITNCIANVTVKGSNNSAGGLLGRLNGGTVENCYVTGSVTGGYNVGGLIGNQENSVPAITIKNCYAFTNISAASATSVNSGIGGLIGSTNATATISNSYTAGSIIYTANATNVIGIAGLVGRTNQTAQISNCYSMSTISVSNSITNARVGGIVGFSAGGSTIVKNCLVLNPNINGVSANTHRVAGSSSNMTLSNNYALSTVKVNGTVISSNNHSSIEGADKTLNELNTTSFYTTAGNWNGGAWDVLSVWNVWNTYSYPYLRTQSSPVFSQTANCVNISGIFRSDVNMDSVIVYKQSNGILTTRVGKAEINNATKKWFLINNGSFSTGDTLLILSHETGKPWPSYPVSVVVSTIVNPLYVKATASGDGSGSSWDNACDGRFLSRYLRASCLTSGQQFYVAEGTYYPYIQGYDNPASIHT